VLTSVARGVRVRVSVEDRRVARSRFSEATTSMPYPNWSRARYRWTQRPQILTEELGWYACRAADVRRNVPARASQMLPRNAIIG
jgi:hypothetical protein